MAGHSQFKNIMYRKGAQDARRAKIFTKIGRELTVAAKNGLPDPDMNPRLRAAIQAARNANMPKDNIERAIKKATAGGDISNFEELRYEGFGPGGVGVIVEALTDNKNRTASDVRTCFSRHGGALAETGSVSYLFERLGLIEYSIDAVEFEAIFDTAVEAGAKDVVSDIDGHQITCNVDSLSEILGFLEERFGDAKSTCLGWQPQTLIRIDDEAAGALFKLLEALEDNDDVQSVASNVEVTDHLLEQLGT